MQSARRLENDENQIGTSSQSNKDHLILHVGLLERNNGCQRQEKSGRGSAFPRCNLAAVLVVCSLVVLIGFVAVACDPA